MKYFRFITALAFCAIAAPAAAGDAPLTGRAEANWRYGNERSILMTEFWVPVAQGDGRVLYGDVRIMADDKDNREGNLGGGYRQVMDVPLAGAGVAGVNLWLDRRISERNTAFHQLTTGVEWLGEDFDVRANAYIPLNDEKRFVTGTASPPTLTGTGIFVTTAGETVEEPQGGFDIELGWEAGEHIDLVARHTDSARFYIGGYQFNGDHTPRITGWRARAAVDVSSDFQIGTRFQKDDERGSQAFLEATIRFPFGHKKSYRDDGIKARLDESPERDIDIVTASAVVSEGETLPVLNAATGTAQQVLYVDNSATGGGDGSKENPFNTLAAAQAASAAHGIIYVHEGDGTSAGQNAGITMNKTGQMLIGSGADFVYDSDIFTVGGNGMVAPTVLIAATNAPVITNNAGDGITISADGVTIAGITIDSASRDGIVVRADGGAASAQNVRIMNVTTQGNRMGMYFHALNGGSVDAMVQGSTASSNTWHGIAVYDDTAGTFAVDLGGGGDSSGNNILAGNIREDLAVDYDGGTLSARNNWWGVATGPDLDHPGIGTAPQIYYGAPIHDGLSAHWTMDTEWVNNTTLYDRSGNGRNGTMQGGLNATALVAGQYGEGLNLDGANDHIRLVASSVFLPGASTPITMITSFKADVIGAGVNSGRLLNLRRLVNSSSVFLHAASTNRASYFTQTTTAVQMTDNPINTTDYFQSAITYDGTTVRPYLNGVADSNVRAAALNAGDGSLAVLGSFEGTTEFFNGVIDDVRIYNRALTATEMAEIYRMNTNSVVDTSGFLAAAP